MPPRTPLVRPDRYFAERDVSRVRLLAIVVVLAVAGGAAVSGVGWVLTSHVDGTVTVDNPDHPAAGFCDEDSPTRTPPGCDEPERVDRNVDEIIGPAIEQFTGITALAFPIAWLATGLLLHLGSWLAGGENGTVESFGVAAWGFVPSLFGIAVALGAIALALDPVTVTSMEDPSAFDPLRRQLRSVQPVTVGVALLTTVWGVVIWRYGLEHERGLTDSAAWAVAGVVGAIVFFGVLV